MPFQNLTGDAEQEYFADGMVEEITTAISRPPWLFVIARNSSFTYKGQAGDVKQVGRELEVRYVLEGSVRKSGQRVRITGQLIDAASGNHIWADRFDGTLDDIFDIQDGVASSVVGAIEPRLRQAEMERAARKPTESRAAYDLYLRALAQWYRFTEEGFRKAVVLARQALAIDPSYAPAAALVGNCFWHQRYQGWGAVSDDDIAEGVRLARQVLETERDDPDTAGSAAFTLFGFAGEAAMAESVLDRVLTLNPNAAFAWLTRGWIHVFRNQPEAAIDAFDRTLRLSPFDPVGYYVAGGLAISSRCATLRGGDRMGRPRLARPAALYRCDARQDRRQCTSRPSRRGACRARPNAGARSWGDDCRVARVRRYRIRAGDRRALCHRPASGRPAGGVSRR